MTDDLERTRLEHRLDQLIWQLAKIEGELTDLRKALNAFRADVITLRRAEIVD